MKKKSFLFFICSTKAWVRFLEENQAKVVLEKAGDTDSKDIKLKDNVLKGDVLEGMSLLNFLSECGCIVISLLS